MKYFYRILYWLTDWDCDFARNTGRNPTHVAYLARQRYEWARLAWLADYPVEI